MQSKFQERRSLTSVQATILGHTITTSLEESKESACRHADQLQARFNRLSLRRSASKNPYAAWLLLPSSVVQPALSPRPNQQEFFSVLKSKAIVLLLLEVNLLLLLAKQQQQLSHDNLSRRRLLWLCKDASQHTANFFNYSLQAHSRRRKRNPTRSSWRHMRKPLLTAIIPYFDRQLLGNKLSLAPCSIHILPNPNKFHECWWFEMFCRIMLRICKKQH